MSAERSIDAANPAQPESATPAAGPLSTADIAQMIAADIPAGAYVNLGIGQPTRVAEYLDPAAGVVLHTENGMLGMGPEAVGDEIDPDLINAGKIPVTQRAGAAFFHHADSFAMMRGGHLDMCVLGAYQVSGRGDLANWSTGKPGAIPAVGGAMDLAIGAKETFVMMTLFTAKGERKLVEQCTFPLTAARCVSRVYTDYGVFYPSTEDADGVVGVRGLRGLTFEQLCARHPDLRFTEVGAGT